MKGKRKQLLGLVLSTAVLFGGLSVPSVSGSSPEEGELSETPIEHGVLFSCEEENLATVGADKAALSFSDEFYRVGTRSLKYEETAPGSNIWFDNAAVDVSDQDFDSLGIAFWINCTDITAFESMSFHLRAKDAGDLTDNRLGWWINSANVIQRSGEWVRVLLPFSEGGSASQIDLSQITGFRISFGNIWVDGVLQPADMRGKPVYFDDIRIVALTQSRDYQYLIEAETEDAASIGADPGYPLTMTEGGAVGSKSLQYQGGLRANGDPAGIWMDYAQPLDCNIGPMEELAVSFWVKTTDINSFEEFRIVLRDSNGRTLCLYPKAADFLKRNDQWGHFYIKLADILTNHPDWINADFDLGSITNLTMDFGHRWIDDVLQASDTTGVTFWFDAFRIEKVSDFQLHNYYENGMLFQQKKPIRLSGTGVPGETVTAVMKKSDGTEPAEGKAVIDADGSFLIELSARDASFDTYTIELTSNGAVETLTDVLVGELWLNAGQSNIELKVSQDLKKDELLAYVTADEQRSRNIRIYSSDTLDVDKSYTPVDEVENAHWKYADSAADVNTVSAVNYTFALELYDRLNQDGAEVPVGILSITKGASQISAWMSRETWDATTDYKEEKWPPKYDESNWNTAPDFYKSTQETAMYNHYIHPLTTLNIGGMVWYQGESDAAYFKTYASALKALIQQYRREFSHGDTTEDIPFVAIQPAPHNYQYAPDNGMPYDMLPNLWETYIEVMNDPDIGNMTVVPIYDLPLDFVQSYGAIHPGIKEPVGRRTAEFAYALAYEGEDGSAPIYQSMRKEGSRLILTFDHVGDGLEIAGGGKTLHGFAICDDKRVFYNAEAEIISQNEVAVSCDGMTDPVAVTYAYAPMNMESNLSNGNAPAYPFRTDEVDSELYRPKVWQYCDSEDIWVSWSALGSAYDTQAGMSPAWKKAELDSREKFSFSFDSTKTSEGSASLKITYSEGCQTFGVTPILEYKNGNGYPGTYNQFENYEALYFDVYNADSREKELVAVEAVTNAGGKYRLRVFNSNGSTAVLPVSETWTTLGVDFRQAYDTAGKPVSAEAMSSIMADVKELNFLFGDDKAGTIYLDNIRFGLAPNQEDIEDNESVASEPEPVNPDDASDTGNSSAPAEEPNTDTAATALPIALLLVMGLALSVISVVIHRKRKSV